jgi:transposase InsO family protein
VLVELGVVEQRYEAVREVLDGVPVTEVARRYGVVRQTVHAWLRRYADAGGVAGLADRSSRPSSCPDQMPAVIEARVVALRVAHPLWGPARIQYQLDREQVVPLPGRTSVYRALVRHGLIDPAKRERKRQDYRRWERGRAMELWQMDVMGGVHLADGTECKVVTGIDDHSRFVVCAQIVARATARPVCDALAGALARHGVPEGVLTDNGRVFTGRFGPGPGPVLFDRVCTENGIRHLLTAPYSPTTTGKVERLHKTMRREHFDAHQRRFATIVEAQAALDAWVIEYNTVRPHQSVGMRPPIERFALAAPNPLPDPRAGVSMAAPASPRPATLPPGISRWVDQKGMICLARHRYRVGPVFAGELVQVLATGGLVQITHRGVLVATHAQHDPQGPPVRARAQNTARAREASTGLTVTRIADGNGAVSFAGTMYRAGRAWAGCHLEVSIVAGSVQLAADGKIIRLHPIRHDRAKEHGAFAQPNGHRRHRKPKPGAQTVTDQPEPPVA